MDALSFEFLILFEVLFCLKFSRFPFSFNILLLHESMERFISRHVKEHTALSTGAQGLLCKDMKPSSDTILEMYRKEKNKAMCWLK